MNIRKFKWRVSNDSMSTGQNHMHSSSPWLIFPLLHTPATEGPHQCNVMVSGLNISWRCMGHGVRAHLEEEGTELKRRHNYIRHNSKKFYTRTSGFFGVIFAKIYMCNCSHKAAPPLNYCFPIWLYEREL